MKKYLAILLLVACFVFAGCADTSTIGLIQNSDGTVIEYYVIPYAENELISAGLTKEESVKIKAQAKIMLDQTFAKYIEEYKARIDASVNYTDSQKEALKKGVKVGNSFDNKTEMNFEIDLNGNISPSDAITYIRYELYFDNQTCYLEFKNANESIKEEKEIVTQKTFFTTTSKVVKDPLFDKLQDESLTLGKKVMGVIDSTVFNVLAGDNPDEEAMSNARTRWEDIKRVTNFQAMSNTFTYCYIVPTARLKSNAQKIIEKDGYYYHIWKIASNNSSLPEDEKIHFEYWTTTANKASWYGLALLVAVVVILTTYFVGRSKEKKMNQQAIEVIIGNNQISKEESTDDKTNIN